MKKLEELDVELIKELRIECGLEDDKEFDNLRKIGIYKVRLEDEYKRCVDEYLSYQSEFNNYFAGDFDSISYFYLGRSEDAEEDWLCDKSVVEHYIELYEEYYKAIRDEFYSLEEHISKIENKKEKNKV